MTCPLISRASMRSIARTPNPSTSISRFESLCGLVELIGPCVDDRMSVDIVEGGHDAVLECLLGLDAYAAQDGAGELGEEALDEVEPGTVLGREGELEAALGLIGEPGFRLFGDVGGMIVEDQLDRRMGRIGLVEKLEEFDELAAAVTVLDQGMDLAGDEIDACQKADGALAVVFVIARQCW